jgi:hypothetical protein
MMIQAWNWLYLDECNWMPLIGSDWKALMVDVSMQFEPVDDMQVETHSYNEYLWSLLAHIFA